MILGIGGSYLAAKAIFDALCHTYHNEMPAKLRMGKPRIYFEGHGIDNDALQDLFELLENSCVDPEFIEERWGIIVISKSGETLETAAAYRAVKSEAAKFYGPKSEMLRRVIVPITGARGSFRDLCFMPRPDRRRYPHHPGRMSAAGSACSPASGFSRLPSWGSTSVPCSWVPPP